MKGKGFVHGTMRGYRYYGCRCDACRTAISVYNVEGGYNRRVGERAIKKRLADENARHPCATPSCDTVVARQSTRCRDCEDARRQERRRQIQGLWHDGLTLKQIADELGTTANSIQVAIVYMRRAGWDMPYRYAWKRLAA